MTACKLTDKQVADFQQDGFIIVKSLFDQEEMNMLRRAKTDEAFQKHAHGLADGEGGVTKLTLWNKAGDDLFGLVARCHRVVDAMEQLLGDEVYHYHSKMSAKEPFTGGAWAWHQDYGYWYLNGCLYPDMASCMIAVDPNTKENGCLQVVRGSNRLGRVEHGRFGDQTGADPERVNESLKHLELVYCLMEVGDACFLHSNTLHRSDQNRSPHPRWSLICCYNTKHNNPYKASHHPFYEKLEKVSDSAIKEAGLRLFSQDMKFWTPEEDKTVGTKSKQ